MIVLSCNKISKSYIVDEIIKDISFQIDEKDKIGLIGLNGSGKTTLLNILAGELERDSGDIYIKKDLKIGYLKQNIDINSENTIFEECLEIFQYLIDMEQNLRLLEDKISLEGEKGESETLAKLMKEYSKLLEDFNNENGYGYVSEIKGIIKGLGFSEEDFNKKINILSGGQKARVYLGKLLLQKPDLLLLDEPTNHLDIDAITWLENFLQEYRGAALIISHDRYFLDNVVNRIFHLENLSLKSYNTDYTRFMEVRKKELDLLRRTYENQQKEIKRQEEIIKRFANYGGERYIRQSISRQKLLDKMKTIDRPVDAKQMKLTFEPKTKSGKDVLRVDKVSKSFSGEKLLEDISFNIYRGDRVGLIGPNGIGKTTLFKIILGQIPYDSGHIEIGSQVHKGYFHQEQDNLNPDKTIIDEIWDENPKFDHFKIRSILSRFLFIGDDLFKEIRDLSGGEKGRLALLKLILSKANFLLMDEPTNHLDIDSKEILEDALLDYSGSLFVISHDRYFLNRVTDKIFALNEDGLKEYLGNYDYYLEKEKEKNLEVEEEVGKTKTQIKEERRKEREKLEEEKRKRKQLKNLEEDIHRLELEIKEVDKLLSDPSLYEYTSRVLEITRDREALQKSLDDLYDKWLLLNNV